jgi:type I restriction enzyme S subunit
VSITAIVGMVGVVDHDLGEAYINQHICLIRPKSQAILPKWMGYFLLSPKGQQLLRVRLYGGTKEGLGLDDIGDLTIPVPPTQAQEVAIKSLEDGERSVSQLCARLVRAISNLREYRTALISAAVTGQIDVSTYRKEPEAVMEVP